MQNRNDIMRFAGKCAALALFNALLAAAFLKIHESRLHYAPWETDSVLLVMPRNETYDVAILGSSRAYLLSRFRDNHRITESELGMRVFNMAMPTGGGLRPARFLLEEFFAQGNRARQVLYFIDPFVFYAIGANDQHKFIYFEPLRFSLLRRLVAQRYPARSILTYIRSKFTPAWVFQKPLLLERHNGALTPDTIDPERIALRMDSLYPDGMQEIVFQRHAGEFLAILECSRAHDAEVTVMVAPTLMGPEIGAARMNAWLESQRAQCGFHFFDFHDALPDPGLYYNLDHLNTLGVERLVRDIMRPALLNTQAGE